jgi:glyoxylase-like metal-dependent hydrolase (beta-lactamase superfamily II)
MKASVAIFAAIPLLVTTSLAQPNLAQVQIKTTAVAKNVHMLEGSGGNIGVSVGPDGILIVDDQFAPLAAKIEAALKQLNPGSLKYVLNTHWHGDHTGGNAHFGKQASIVAQENVRKRLADNPDTPKEALPVVTFNQGASIFFNDDEIRLIHLGPGHTDGDSVIWFKGANVVHMGDQFFNGRFPFVDLASGGDVGGLVKNIEAVLKQIPADAKVIPGHGPLGTVADLKTFHEMLVETTGVVKRALAAGKSLDEVKAAGLPDKWKDWGTGFINTSRWLEITYNNFAKR